MTAPLRLRSPGESSLVRTTLKSNFDRNDMNVPGSLLQALGIEKRAHNVDNSPMSPSPLCPMSESVLHHLEGLPRERQTGGLFAANSTGTPFTSARGGAQSNVNGLRRTGSAPGMANRHSVLAIGLPQELLPTRHLATGNLSSTQWASMKRPTGRGSLEVGPGIAGLKAMHGFI